MRQFRASRFIRAVLTALVIVTLAVLASAVDDSHLVSATAAGPEFYRPFLPTSRWRQPLGRAPVHTHNSVYLENMTSADPATGASVARQGVNVPYPLFNGAEPGNLYSQGFAEADATSARYKLIYYDDGSAKSRRTVYHNREHVAITRGLDGKGGVRVPHRLRTLYDMTDPNSLPRRGSRDAGALVVDRELDVHVHGPYILHLEETKYFPRGARLPTEGWWEEASNAGRLVTEPEGVFVVNGTSFYAADSLGVASATAPPQPADTGYDLRNGGHRGIPGNVMFATFAEVATGDVGHPLSLTLSHTGYTPVAHYWPLSGQENRRKGVIPEGTFVRIKAALTDAEIAGRVRWIATPEGRAQAATLARALRDYGAFVGDNGGSSCRVRLETGRPWALPTDALKHFVFRATAAESDWEFVAGGYDPATRTIHTSPANGRE